MNAILYKPGDKIRVKMREYTSNQSRTYTGKIEEVTKKFITVHTGNYRVTVLVADLICGQAKIEKIR